MEVDNAALSLACLARGFHGASVEDASMMARKAIEVAGKGADEIDMIDALDDVWAASFLAGTFVVSEDIIHPDNPKEQHPKRYEDANLVAHKKKRTKKRRSWDKN